MKFEEYPKAMIRGDAFTTVASAEEESARRADGWYVSGEQAPADQGVDERDVLLARAKDLGIDAKGTWGAKRLKEAIAAKETEAK